MKATLQIKITSGLLLTHKVATFPWGFVPLLMLLGLKAKSLALNSNRLGLATVPSTLTDETNSGGSTEIEDVFRLAPWGRGIMEGSSTPKSAFRFKQCTKGMHDAAVLVQMLSSASFTLHCLRSGPTGLSVRLLIC